jgi:hypothetical protein
MKRVFLIVSIAVLAVACPKKEEPNTTSTATTAPATATQAAATSAPVPVPSTATPAPAPATPSAGALATQETNWKGIVAEVTEFRRKGNTLTAKVRLTNRGSEESKAEVIFKEAYLIDTAGGKKYEVLKDEKGTFIASLTQGWNDRWYDSHLKPGDSYLLWMKFPAPPAETKAITLQIPSTPPFEDVNIQD